MNRKQKFLTAALTLSALLFFACSKEVNPIVNQELPTEITTPDNATFVSMGGTDPIRIYGGGTSLRFHMNWGHGMTGPGNGWFIENSVAYYGSPWQQWNYQDHRTNMCVYPL